MRIVAGIDPGKSGGYTELTEDGRLIQTLPLDEGLVTLINRGRAAMLTHVFVEKAQVMNRGGVRAGAVPSFTYGVGFGEILGILRALCIPHTQVPPAVWSRVMHAGTAADQDTKARSLEACRRLFPEQSWLLGKARKPHDGLTEASLLAEYGRRTLFNHHR